MAHTISGASLDGIYNRLNSIQRHHPLEAETFSDWSVEAGDIVTISRDGKSYQSPIHSSTIKWKGKAPTVSVNSTGNEKREAVSKVSRQKYNRGGSGLRNSQKIYGDVWSEDGHLHSFVNQTASRIYGYVEDVYNQMRSGLELTSSTAALYVQDAYNQMTSGLALTSSSAALYVSNSYTRMTAGLKATSSSAVLYAKSADNAAEIVARINESTGESEIKLDANRVYIGNSKSTTIIAGKCSLSDVTADYIQAKIASLASLNVVSLTSERGGISVNSVSTSSYYQGDVSCYVPHAIWDLNLVDNGNNTYTLQRKRFSEDAWTNVGTFSRATTVTLGGYWSGDNTGNTATRRVYVVGDTTNYNESSVVIHQNKSACWVTDPNGTIRARIDNPQYGNGWDAAYDCVSLPSSSNTGSTFTVYTPPSSVDGSANGTTYTIHTSTQAAYVTNPSGTIVCRNADYTYSGGVIAGQNSVNVSKGGWYTSGSYQKCDFSPSVGTGSGESVSIWGNLDGANVKVYDGTEQILTVSAAEAYNNGGKTAYVRKARTGDYSSETFLLEVPSSSVTLGSPLYIRARAGYFDSDEKGHDTEHYGYIKVNVPNPSGSISVTCPTKTSDDATDSFTATGSANGMTSGTLKFVLTKTGSFVYARKGTSSGDIVGKIQIS